LKASPESGDRAAGGVPHTAASEEEGSASAL